MLLGKPAAVSVWPPVPYRTPVALCGCSKSTLLGERISPLVCDLAPQSKLRLQLCCRGSWEAKIPLRPGLGNPSMIGPLFGLLSKPQQPRAQESKRLRLRKQHPAFPPPTSVPVQGLRCHPGSPRNVLNWYPGPLLPPMAPKLLSSRLPWKSVSFRSESLTRPVSGVTAEGGVERAEGEAARFCRRLVRLLGSPFTRARQRRPASPAQAPPRPAFPEAWVGGGCKGGAVFPDGQWGTTEGDRAASQSRTVRRQRGGILFKAGVGGGVRAVGHVVVGGRSVCFEPGWGWARAEADVAYWPGAPPEHSPQTGPWG